MVFVQMNGWGSSFQFLIRRRMSASRTWTFLCAPRRIIWSARNPNHGSTWLIHEDPVGVKCMWKRGCLASNVLIVGVLWVP